MAEFELPKSLDDIQDRAPLLESDWYKVRLVKEAKLEPNKKKKGGAKPSEGARDNLVLRLRVVSTDPAVNGRPFTKWLPMPNELDFDVYDEIRGVPKGDAMLSDALRWSVALGNDCSDGKLHFESGQECYIYITQGYDNRVESPTEDDLRNEIDINSHARSVAEME